MCRIPHIQIWLSMIIRKTTQVMYQRHNNHSHEHRVESSYKHLTQLPYSNRLQRHGTLAMLLCVVIDATVAKDVTRRKSCGICQRLLTQRTYTVLRRINVDTLRMRWKHLWWRDRRAEGWNSQRTSRRRRWVPPFEKLDKENRGG